MLRCALLVLATALSPSIMAADSADPLAGLEYRQVGPNAGGRLTKVSGVIGDPLTWYLAAAQGGVWKSVDGGAQWQPIFDQMPSVSVGSLAVAPSDPNVIYVGGGEGNVRGNAQPGEGLFVSTDAGKSWQHSLKLRVSIGDIEVDPQDADIAYAAVLGSPFASNPERGVYRTRDAGKSWQQVLKIDADSGASDVSIDVSNPRIVWAGSWQMRRSPWGMESGGEGSGLWRSADGGDTWTRLSAGQKGLPEGDWGKVGVAVSPADGNRIYALIEAKEGGLFRSDDGGDSFERINDHWVLRQRAWYYMTLVPDPKNADVVWFPQVRMQRTLDGGKTVQPVGGFAHGDHHDIWIDSSAPSRMISGNDGGVELSVTGGNSWRKPNLPLGQFYHIDVDGRWPYHVGGTLQDMGTVSGPIVSLAGDGTSLADWRYVGGGEAGDFRYDLAQPGTVYAGEYSGYLSRYVENTGQYRNISSVPASTVGLPAEAMRERFQWTAPIELSPHDPATIYHGANVLFRSRDRGETWIIISPDLTRNDKRKQRWAGGPITGDNTGVEVYSTIFAIDESALTQGEIWVGSDDGRVHISRDDGANWTEITPSGLPSDATVASLRISIHQAGRAYLVAHRYRLGDDRPYIYTTENYGRSWRSLSASLPQDMPLYAIVEDERDPQLLYLGAERAVYASSDAGQHWRDIQLNLPPVAVVDIEAAHNDLILGTRGRGLYAFHDLSALRLALKGKPESAQLVSPAAATRWRAEGRWGSEDGSSNPPYGAIFSYYLPNKIEGELTLRVLDAQGQLVRELSSVPKPMSGAKDDPDQPAKAPKPELSTDAGWHRVAWNLAHAGAQRLGGAKFFAGNPESGPLALPGEYRAELSGPNLALNAHVTLLADPRSPVDAAAMAEQLAFALQLRGDLERTRLGIEWVRAAREQAADLSERLQDDDRYGALVTAATAVANEADTIEGQMHNPEAKVAYDFLRGPKGPQLYSKLAGLFSSAQDSDHAPSAGMRAQYARFSAELATREAAIQQMQTGSVAALEAAVIAAQLPRLILPATSGSAR